MLNTKEFGQELQKLGFNFFCGVPCSYLKYLINYVINEANYIPATNEGDAVAICTGAYIGGKKSVVLMQNSGLTNAISPLTSLNSIFKIPILGFISLRGEEGINDEPQHALMGRITTKFLSTMGICWEILSSDLKEVIQQLSRAYESIEKGQAFFFVVKKGTFSKVALSDKQEKTQHTTHPNKKIINIGPERTCPTRRQALEDILSFKNQHTVFIGTNRVY